MSKGGDNMTLGEKIREIRVSKGITQTHIIKKLGKHNSWLSQVESGTVSISAEDLKLVSDEIEVPITDFFLDDNFTDSKVKET